MEMLLGGQEFVSPHLGVGIFIVACSTIASIVPSDLPGGYNGFVMNVKVHRIAETAGGSSHG